MKIKHLIKIKFAISVTFVVIFTCFQGLKAENWEVKSPDKKIKISVSLLKNTDDKGSLQYQVNRRSCGKTIKVIEPSPLGIIRADQQFSNNLSFVSASSIKTIDENYEMKVGRQLQLRNNANELTLSFKNDKGSTIQLVLRAYNDGVAFKYVFPEKSEKKYTINQELTGFRVSTNGKVWMQPYDVPSQWTPGYELYYKNGIPIGTESPNKEGWAFPSLFQTKDNWTLISEANLGSNYCGIRLEQNAENGLYKVRFPEKMDGQGYGKVNPTSTLPWDMPWRTVITGKSLTTIFESQLINNVSNEPVSGDFSWVKPGRASWSWISNPASCRDFNALKDFVDLSAEMKWEYSLVDANWNEMQGGDIEELVKYANTKGVGIIMWYNSGGPNNIVTEGPRDIMSDPIIRKAEFKKLQQWGVKGVKIDFWQSDKQITIQQYHDLMKDAAECHIMVGLHGCTIPRGWSKTYPNMNSMESVRGEECYRFDTTYTDNAPVQNTIIPFTRNVIGPMDYTPFGISDLKFPYKTTFAHELALTIVFNNGIIHFTESAEGIRKLPEFVKDFLVNVPATFDESHLISGYPGKDIIIASRKDDLWYVAGINGENETKKTEVKLPFLKNGKYEINFITDGGEGKGFENKKSTINSKENISVTMIPNGGFVAILKAI